MNLLRWSLILLGGVVCAGEVSRVPIPPAVSHKTTPRYTPEALEAKLEGIVAVSAMIGADSTASEFRIVKALGKGLDEEAIKCLKEWKFKPATYDGFPAAMRVQVEIKFTLDQARVHAR